MVVQGSPDPFFKIGGRQPGGIFTIRRGVTTGAGDGLLIFSCVEGLVGFGSIFFVCLNYMGPTI